jgi:hypothetical protein
MTVVLASEAAGELAAIRSRLDAIDEATRLFHDDLVRVPTAIDRAISSQNTLMEAKFSLRDEMFKGVDLRFVERDARFAIESTNHTRSLDAALKSANESSDKTEKSLTEAIRAVEKQVADLRERLSDKLSRDKGGEDTVGRQLSMGALAVSVIVAIVAVLALFLHKG